MLTFVCNRALPKHPRMNISFWDGRYMVASGQPPPHTTHPQGRLGRHLSSAKVNSAPQNQPVHNSSVAVVTASPHNQIIEPEGQFLPLMFDSNQVSTATGKHTQLTQETYLEYPAYVTKKIVEHVLHKVAMPRPGDIAELPSIQKRSQRGSQNEETKKKVPNERTEQSSRKRIKQNRDNLPDAEFETRVIKMLNNSVRTSTKRYKS